MPIVLYSAVQGLGQGSSGGVVPGTRRSVPGGVESTFEFNGLLMNQRQWWDTFIVNDIDGLDDADVRDTREQNPGFHGETAFDSLYGGRTIILSGLIRAYSLHKLRDLEQGMRYAFGDLQEHPLVIRSGFPELDVMISAKKFQKLTIKEIQTDFRHVRAFQIALRAAAPFFLSYTERYAPITMDVSPKSVAVVNDGNFAAEPRFNLVGPLTNPQIVNVTTGDQMTLNGTIASGSSVEVDVRHKTIRDINGVNKFSMLDVTSDWLRLVSGSNTIQLSATGLGAGSVLQIFWYNTYL